MRDISVDQQAILDSGRACKRTFIAQTYLDSDDDEQVLGLWDGDFAVSKGGVDYIPMAGLPDLTSMRQYQVSDLSIPGLQVTFPGIVTTPFYDLVNDVNSTWHQQPVEVFIGLFAKPAPTVLVDDLIPWFYGFLDKVTVTDSPIGGSTTMRCYYESIARELSRNNLSVRSDLDQRERDPVDRGYETIGAEKNWNWGGVLKKQQVRRSKRIERRGARGDT